MGCKTSVEVGPIEGNGLGKEPDDLIECRGLALLGLGVEDVGIQDLVLDGVVELEGFEQEIHTPEKEGKEGKMKIRLSLRVWKERE